MSKIDQRISPYPGVPERTDENFYDDMEAWVMHGANTVANEQNIMADEINIVADEINQIRDEANEIKNIAVNSKDLAKNYSDSAQESASYAQNSANIATQKADEIAGYVVPTNATYTPEEIDNKIQTKGLEDFLGFNF